MEYLPFNLNDIIVYDVAITRYGFIMHFIQMNEEDDDLDIRLATREEIRIYYDRPEK